MAKYNIENNTSLDIEVLDAKGKVLVLTWSTEQAVLPQSQLLSLVTKIKDNSECDSIIVLPYGAGIELLDDKLAPQLQSALDKYYDSKN